MKKKKTLKDKTKIYIGMLICLSICYSAKAGPPADSCPSGLCNRSMEDTFINGVAKYWGSSGSGYFNEHTYYVHEGNKSQEISWNGFGSEEFGPSVIYQSITALQPSASYLVSAWFKFRFEAMMGGEGWIIGEIEFSVGSDPNGGTNPDVVNNWMSVQDSAYGYYEGDWQKITTFLSPVNDTATLFIKCEGTGDAVTEEPGCTPGCDPYVDPGCIPCEPMPAPWDAFCYIDDVNLQSLEIDSVNSTATATTPIAATGASYSEVTITVLNINGVPLEDIPAAEIIINCSGSGNQIFGLTPTDANGQTVARIASTVAETKTVSITVLGTALSDTPLIEFSEPVNIYKPCKEMNLLASDGASYDHFGNSVAVDGDTAIVGAYSDDDNGNNSGSAYVFGFDGSNWIEQEKLLASDGAAGDNFGISVAVDGDTAVVGAYHDDANGNNSGSAYVFVFDGSSWIEEAKLLASDGAADDNFGNSVAVDGNAVIIGAAQSDANGYNSGSVYVFGFDGTNWIEEAKLLASDGASYDYFGNSVAIYGDIVLIGSYYDDDNGSGSGSVYAFNFDGSNWNEVSKLLASDGSSYDYFGCSVALDDDVAIIGAKQNDDYYDNSGSAYIFRSFDGMNWTQEAKLLAYDVAEADNFGFSVAIDGETAIVGATFDDDNGYNSGSVYIFRFDGQSWVGQLELLAFDGASGDRLGYAVDIDGDTILAGAYDDDNKGYGSGSAYIFKEQLGDFDKDCKVDFFDFAILASSWLSDEGHSNWNRTCNLAFSADAIDLSDLSLFGNNWLTNAQLGDFYKDGKVDFMDFAILASSWLSAEGQINWNRMCNIAPSIEIINLADIAVFADYWLERTQ